MVNDKQRDRQYKRLYGISLDFYNNLLLLQNYQCAICCRSGFKLEVDHDHETNVVRGLLCRRCNLTLQVFDNEQDFKRFLAHSKKGKK